jgi:hypothetical protein
MALLAEIGQYLQDQGVGTQGTNIFLSMRPDSPDAVIGIYEGTGRKPFITFGNSLPVAEQPVIQVITRAARGDYATARATAETVYKKLAVVVNQTLSSTTFHAILPLGQPAGMGDDEDGRPLIACEYLVIKDIS